jgi:hypothetical protein
MSRLYSLKKIWMGQFWVIYVDDILLGSNSSKEIEWFEHMLESKFKITKGPVDEILGIKIQETSDHTNCGSAIQSINLI